MAPTDAERRSRLLGITLRTLAAEHGAADPGEPQAFAPGAALVAADEAWVLLDRDPARRLGSAIAWARRQGVDRVVVVATDATGTLARRAAAFDTPIDVRRLDGRTLHPAAPEPLAVPPAPRPEHLALADLIAEGGAVPLVEHGVVLGEVRGLEVCRVVDDPHTGAVRLEVGIGAHDREAFAVMYGDVPVVDALRGVVDMVTANRVPGRAPHPLMRVAPERLLRWRLEQEPHLVGAAELFPAQPPVPRAGLKDADPCVATGTSTDGSPVVVVCSSGVDLDVIPYATDARLGARVGPSGDAAATIVAVPARDLLAITEELAAALREPIRLVGVG